MPFDSAPQTFSDNSKALESRERKKAVLDKLMHDAEFQEYCFELWFADIFQTGVENPETGEVYPVVDIQKLIVRFKDKFRISGVTVEKFDALSFLQTRFTDTQFLTTYQVAQQEYAPKPLFFWPESLEEITHEASVKSSRFHLLASDVIQRANCSTIEVADENGEIQSVEYLEAEFAVVLLHPEYGNAFRDHKGVLYVYDQKSKEFTQLNYKYLERSLGFGVKIFNQETSGDRQPRTILEGMQQRCPHLFEAGILQEGDIRQTMRRIEKGSNDGNRPELYIQKAFTGAGSATYNGVVHFVGRKYAPKERPGIKTMNISNDTAVILDEEGLVEGYFNLFTQDDPEVIKGGGNGKQVTYNVGVSDTKVKDIAYEAILPQKEEEESEMEHDAHIQAIKRGLTTLYTQVLPGVPNAQKIIRNLSLHEQANIARIVYWLDKYQQGEQLKTFVTMYGIDGLRTFSSLQDDEAFSAAILQFSQHKEVAQKVFSYYGALLDSADNAEQLVREFTQEESAASEQVEQVRANILNRAQKDLVQAVQSDSIEDLYGKLDTYTVGAKEYVALLQEVGEGKNIEVKAGGTLTNDDKTQMRTLLRANYGTLYPYKKDDEFGKAVADSLEQHLDDPHTIFRILYDGAKIVSFNRFDTLQDAHTGREVTYFGSFNAATPYSGVGGVMLERTIEEQLQSGVPMMAHCDPTQKISMKYIENGFVATDIYALAGKPSFEIWRSDESSKKIRSKNMSREEIVSLQDTKEDNLIVRTQQESDAYSELQEGFALTRFFSHNGKTYVVFEALPAELQSLFTPPQEKKKKVA